MYKWEFTGKIKGHLILDTDDQNTKVEPQWALDSSVLKLVEADLRSASGVYGRTIKPERFTPADFCHYMTKSKILEGEMVEGEIGYYDPGIPEGSVP